MEQLHDTLFKNLRLSGADNSPKVLRTIYRTAMSGI